MAEHCRATLFRDVLGAERLGARVRFQRRRFQIAVVATARTLVVLCWHLIHTGHDYAFARH